MEFNYGSAWWTWALGSGSATFGDTVVKANAIAFSRNILSLPGTESNTTGLKEGQIDISCDQDNGHISFNPRRKSDIASVEVAAAVDMKGEVDISDPTSGSVSVDIAVSFKEPLAIEISGFGITVKDQGTGINDKDGATVAYVCKCKKD